MFSWRPSKKEVTIYDYHASEEQDKYILENAVHLHHSMLPDQNRSATPEKYIAYLYPNKDGKKNFSKMVYPVIVDDSVEPGYLLESKSISTYLGHYNTSTQCIEVKKWEAKDGLPINKITFQINSLLPRCNEPLNINRDVLIKSIHNFFIEQSFPLCVGQMLVVPYPREIEMPRAKHLSFMKPVMFSPKFKLMITSINGEMKCTDDPKIYQLNKKSVMTLDVSPNTSNICFLSNEEEKQLQDDIERKAKEAERKVKEAERENTRSSVDLASKKNKSKSYDGLPGIKPLVLDFDLDDIGTPPKKLAALPNQLSFDFTRCGIGGNKDALRELVSQVFYSRALGQYAKNYGAKPVKGVLLYGPPGTGKTSIARAIASFFSKSQVRYVNGPELMNKFVGESESALRNLFAEAQSAWQLYKENSPLFVIIFDEIDASFPKRGTRSGGTGVDDKMTSQMLTLMDGLDDIGNVLIIGTTNRPDMLDDALKRENRFSLMLEIGLPDTVTRKEILELKTQQPRSSNLLEEGVDFQYWAEKSAGFSGADLEQFVRMAENYAQTRNFEYDQETNTLKLKPCVENNVLEVVKKTDFERAFLNIKPSNRMDKDEFNFQSDHFVIYNEELGSVAANYLLCIKQLCRPYSNRMSFLLAGKPGTGKTDLAKFLAEKSDFDSIKLVTPEHFLGKSMQAQLETLEDFFRQAVHIDKCIIILDNLEGILSASGDNLRKENALVLKLISLMNRHQTGTKCMIIATAQDAKMINHVGINFDEVQYLSSINLTYNDSKTLDIIAKPLQIHLSSDDDTGNEVNIRISMNVRQILHLLKKLVDDDGCVDKLDFFKMASKMYESKKQISDRESEITALPGQSLFAVRK